MKYWDISSLWLINAWIFNPFGRGDKVNSLLEFWIAERLSLNVEISFKTACL